jgi:hypothetical protein
LRPAEVAGSGGVVGAMREQKIPGSQEGLGHGRCP